MQEIRLLELSVPTMAELFTDADDILITYTVKQKITSLGECQAPAYSLRVTTHNKAFNWQNLRFKRTQLFNPGFI